jgi:hypothetical protein
MGDLIFKVNDQNPTVQLGNVPDQPSLTVGATASTRFLGVGLRWAADPGTQRGQAAERAGRPGDRS